MTQVISIENMISIMDDNTRHAIKGKTYICNIVSNPDIQTGSCYVKLQNHGLLTINMYWPEAAGIEIMVHDRVSVKKILDLDIITDWRWKGYGRRYTKIFDTIEDMFNFAENLVNTILRA